MQAAQVTTIRQLAKKVGAEYSCICRDQRLGGFTPTTADRWAVALGKVPGLVWGDLWWDLPDGSCGPVDNASAELQKRNKLSHRAKRMKEREVA